MRIHPGQPYPLGATWDGRGVNFALFSEHATRGRAVPVRSRRCARGVAPRRAARAHRSGLARLPAGRAARTALRLPRARALRPGERPPLQPHKVVLDPYAKAIGRRLRVVRRDVRLPHRRCRRGPLVRRARQRRRRAARGRRRHRLHLGRRPAAAHPVAQDHHLRDARASGFTMRHPEVPERCAAPTPAWSRTRRYATCRPSASPRSSCMPVHHHVDDRHLVERGLSNYWGYNTLGFFAPDARFASGGSGLAAVNEFKTMVRALHAAGIEVILDVVYNHTAEGNHLGPTLSMRGIDNAAYYRLVQDDRALLHGLHRLRQHAQHDAPARAAAHHGQPALLGARDARRRLPLRPRERARARAVRRQQAERVLRRHPPGPRAVAGEAHRRAVGRRPGRLPGRQLPGAVDGVERPLPRQRAPLLARRRRPARPSSRPASPAAATCTSTAAGGPTRASTSSPRTTASRCSDLVSYNDKHNEANGEDNRDGDDNNHSWNCGAEGADRRPGDPRAARAAEAQLPRHAAAVAGRARCCCGGDELGRTQQRQQQRLLPGQRDQLARLGTARATTPTCSSSPAR